MFQMLYMSPPSATGDIQAYLNSHQHDIMWNNKSSTFTHTHRSTSSARFIRFVCSDNNLSYTYYM